MASENDKPPGQWYDITRARLTAYATTQVFAANPDEAVAMAETADWIHTVELGSEPIERTFVEEHSEG